MSIFPPPTADPTDDEWFTGLLPPDPVEIARATAALADDLGIRYELQGFLGRGAFATVWQARDRVTGETVAVKRFNAGGDSAGFFREMRSLFRLDHPRIVRLVNFAEAGASRYLILEHCGGGNLRRLLGRMRRRCDGWPADTTLPLVRQIAAGLAAAHAVGLIHRDLKPENILFEAGPETDFGRGRSLKLGDFGLARSWQAPAATTPGDRLPGLTGSPAYMAPEQFAGECSPAADVYALGVIWFEMLHGRLPFEGSVEQLAYHHLRTEPRPDDGLPPAIRHLLLRLLDKSPERRPADGTEVLGRLDELERGIVRPYEPPTPAPPPPIPRALHPWMSRCLGCRADSMIAAKTPEGRPIVAIATENGLFRRDAENGRTLDTLPLVGLRNLQADEAGGLWMTQEERLVHHPVAGTAPLALPAWNRPLRAWAGRAIPGPRVLACTAREVREFAPPDARPRWATKFAEGTEIAAATWLTDGGLAVALRLPAPELIRVSADRTVTERHSLPFVPRRLLACDAAGGLLLDGGPTLGGALLPAGTGTVLRLPNSKGGLAWAVDFGGAIPLRAWHEDRLILGWTAAGEPTAPLAPDLRPGRCLACAIAAGNLYLLSERDDSAWLSAFRLDPPEG